MFKRVEKRRRKKEEEEELGLDDEMKEVLGMQDTDSDESNSDSDDSESEVDAEGEVRSELEGEDGEKSEQHDDESDTENPEISVLDALDDPVYLVSLDPDVKACIVCPGKLLKNAKMIEIHIISGVSTFDLPILILRLICESSGS